MLVTVTLMSTGHRGLQSLRAPGSACAMELLFVFVTLLIGSRLVSAHSDWTYWGETGPAHWPDKCVTGTQQSPINIVTEDAVKMDMGSLKFVRYEVAYTGTITNNGHSVEIRLNGLPIMLQGADLPATYGLEQMHFHWGAEHTMDSVRDALELHFVHYDKQYENAATAVHFKNGIAVVATLFELSKQDNPDLAPILEATASVSKWVGKNEAELRSKIIPYLFLPKDYTSYYRYDGSLTTPGCQESVMWFVMAEKLTISEEQLRIFKNVWTHNSTLLFNYRPTQSLGDRKVYHHLEGYSAAAIVSSNLLYTVVGLLLVRILSQ